MSKQTIALVGNPNCGKTTLFNALTGARQRVGKWPGVTVERKEGTYRDQGQTVTVVDLPGIYSLDVAAGGTGLDEQVARDYLLSGEANLVVNILDASNLERNLYLTTQLLEMGVPLVIALNMMDQAEGRGIRIDVAGLQQRLGCPVVPLCAHRGRGVAELKAVIRQALTQPQGAGVRPVYPPLIEQAFTELSHEEGLGSPWAVLYWLQSADRANDSPALPSRFQQYRQEMLQTLGEEIDLLIADVRYTWIREVVTATVTLPGQVSQTISERIDRWVLHRWLGIPIFLVIMYVMFFIAINVGGVFIDFFDIGVGTIAVDGTAHVLQQLHAPGWLIGLLADGVGGGIQTTATFIPQIGLLFVLLSVLEDSGYLARAAFVMDRLMRWIGLPGKSFVPMLVGFGCNIPAIMATRTLENRRDRLMTILMNPFMSCGARLSVYALFGATFFPKNAQNVVFLLYLIGIGAAVFTGLVMKSTLLQGIAAPFIMELPPYHLPTLKGVAIHAWGRLQAFITKAGRMIIVMVMILGLLNSVGTDGSFGKQDSTDSLLSAVGRQITPVFAPMGVRPENWPATVGLFTGMFAKEVMVGTMNSLYGQLAQAEAAEVGEPPAEFDLWGGLQEAVTSIPQNFAALGEQLLDPLGMGVVRRSGDEEAVAEELGVQTTTFGQMALRFGSTTAAIAFLLFVLLYFPCVSATAAIYRETNLGWTVFVAGWTTGLAYWVATFYYQFMTFNEHPARSLLWVLGLMLVQLGVLWGLRAVSSPRLRRVPSGR
ncbi:Fe(2+) transporter permease subunit FeoB [Synechococcus sp. W60.1]|uniref:Fe(2+) transporter permease subunit FeoB n=1 Tax=Synechococcus sp. W60.1 TaxID=2964516 RepID=UPI0039C16F77